jgi:hypothetical protein
MAAGGTETTQENIQEWLELDEGDPGFQLLTDKKFLQLFFCLFSSGLPILLHFPFICL